MTNIAEFRMYQERWRKAVRRCEDLTDRQKVILLALQEYENVESRTAWPSRDMLAADCALRGEVKSMRRNVTNALSAGNRLGFIEVSSHAVSPGRAGGRGRSTVWRLTLPEGKLTDKSVRKDSVKGDPSVTVSGGSNIKGDRRSAKRVIVESPKGDPGIPPNPVGTPDKNPSYSGGPGSADAGKDEDDSFTELLAAHPKPEKSSKARHHWRAVIEEGHTPADIIAWARGYAEWAKTSEPRFVKALGGWLEARHWANQPGGVSYRKAVGEDEQRAIVAAAVLKRAETMGNPSELERLTGLSIGNEDALNVMLRDEHDLLATLIVDGLRAGKQPNSY